MALIAGPFGRERPGRGEARAGKARAGKARAGKARAGKARAGKARAGKARAGKARAGSPPHRRAVLEKGRRPPRGGAGVGWWSVARPVGRRRR
ncbi:hypothetical protein GCM10009779_14490 [Polymorphospora rubra]